jgi:lactate dehydrogenase-like 2-hydroxyacid dehydrogenase
MKKNITVLCPRDQFSLEQLQKLELAGSVTYLVGEATLHEMKRISKEAEIIGFNPEKLGKEARLWIAEILEHSPNVKGLAVNTVEYGYVDEEYCKLRGIRILGVHETNGEAVFEHTILLLLACAKRFIINEKRTFKRRFLYEDGVELRGKTLGIIGMNEVGAKVAKIAIDLGMRVYLWNEQPIRMAGVERQELSRVLSSSDLITIHLPDTEVNKKFLSKEKIGWINDGAIVINLSSKDLVDEKAMAEALKKGVVGQYVCESESTNKSPLQGIEMAHITKPYSKLTREARVRNYNEWVRSISNLAGYPTS